MRPVRSIGVAAVFGIIAREMMLGQWRPYRVDRTLARSFRKALAAIPLALAAAALLMVANPASAHETPAYSHDDSTGETNPDWMSTLPDTVKLSHLSIPGTHDTGARTGGDSVDTQSMDIPTQLMAGIRAFDIRLGKAAGCDSLTDDFQIIHGEVPGFRYCQPDTFSQALSYVDTFLSQHGGETVVMRIKEETDDPSADDFTTIVNHRLQALSSGRVYQGANTDPMLKDIRDKIVVLWGNGYGTGSVPAWPGNIKWADLNKQDAYHMITNWDLASKWDNAGGRSDCDNTSEYPNSCNNVVHQFQNANNVSCDPRSSEDCGSGTIYVNHLSAVYPSGFPYFFASGHSNPATGAPRLASIWTGGGGSFTTCGGASQCISPQYYPIVDCAGESVDNRTCTVLFEGLNVLAMHYVNNSESGWLWRTGIVFSDFPGKGLISAIIAVNTRRFNHGDYDVGVSPATATGCSRPEDAVTIHTDDEDHNNINNVSGWVGGITQDSGGTTFRFCRVDGSAFHPIAGAGIPNRNYAVLRLGNSCPPGSVEFVRHFDNEDEDNGNFIVGDAWPNSQTPDTDLHFCLFQPTVDGGNPSFDSFPSFSNLPNGYGVFAPLNFLDLGGPKISGTVFTDDEDYHNQDQLIVPPGAAADVAPIIYGDSNTNLNVMQVTSGGGQCYNAPPFASCDDGDPCTTNDECFGGNCSGSPVICLNPADQCHLAAACDPSTGGCVNPPVPDGTTCDDGDPCTHDDQCTAGTCAGTPYCPAPDRCHLTATCDPTTHACNAAPAVLDGTLCDDGNACTAGDQCIAGVCTGTLLPDTTPCDDGNPCTDPDFCFEGRCSGNIVPGGTACDDGNVCTTNDQCDGAGHCTGTFVPNGTACDDGNACTTNDQCYQGQCILVQDVPGGTACNDGNACTTNDQCDGAGHCTGTYFCAAPATPAPTATASPTVTDTPAPTPTPSLGPCIGDCNGDRAVTVDEVLTMVNMALGNGGSCPDGVPAGVVPDVSLIVQAVNNALNGCPS